MKVIPARTHHHYVCMEQGLAQMIPTDMKCDIVTRLKCAAGRTWLNLCIQMSKQKHTSGDQLVFDSKFSDETVVKPFRKWGFCNSLPLLPPGFPPPDVTPQCLSWEMIFVS